MRSALRVTTACLIATFAASCTPGNADVDDPQQTASPDGAAPGEMAAQAEWEPLFDGSSTGGWRGYNQPDMPSGWQAVDGALTRVAEAGDIITIRQFRSFELELEWMVRAAGNSGIFYRVVESSDPIYYSGPEMQVLDDAGHVDGGSPLTAAGANYGLHPAPEGVVRAAGEWNSVRLIVNGNHVEHWLNDSKVVEYELGSDDWKQRVAASKFVEWPAYGQAERGHIGLQDHGDWVAFRNIRIRELP